MRNSLLLILPSLLLFSCGVSKDYSGLIRIMQPYQTKGLTIYSNYSDAHYSSVDIFGYGDNMCVSCTNSDSTSEADVHILLPMISSAPGSFSCAFSFHGSSAEVIGSYSINRYYSYNTSINFNSFSGDDSLKSACANLAKDMTGLALICLRSWVIDRTRFTLGEMEVFYNF